MLNFFLIKFNLNKYTYILFTKSLIKTYLLIRKDDENKIHKESNIFIRPISIQLEKCMNKLNNCEFLIK